MLADNPIFIEPMPTQLKLVKSTAMDRAAIITGITGQDGSYLAELLLRHGYEVHGVVRDKQRLGNIAHLQNKLHLHAVNLLDQASVNELIASVQPDEYYHLGGPTFIPHCLAHPVQSTQEIAMSTVVALEAIRSTGRQTRFMQAGSSEMFGRADAAPQNEDTPFRPHNPYASAKTFSHHLVKNFRDHFNVFACNAILFNHESPRRGEHFVTRKISLAAARIKLGLQDSISLGNLSVQRDWGYAGDVVEAFWKMLQQPTANDYAIGTGCLTSLEQVVAYAFERVNLDWRQYVVFDQQFARAAVGVPHCADITRARRELGWEPTVTCRELIHMMVDHDLLEQAREHSRAPQTSVPMRRSA